MEEFDSLRRQGMVCASWAGYTPPPGMDRACFGLLLSIVLCPSSPLPPLHSSTNILTSLPTDTAVAIFTLGDQLAFKAAVKEHGKAWAAVRVYDLFMSMCICIFMVYICIHTRVHMYIYITTLPPAGEPGHRQAPTPRGVLP